VDRVRTAAPGRDRRRDASSGDLDAATRAALGRYLARQPQTLKERVAKARGGERDSKEFVLKAAKDMAAAGTWSFEEQAAEVTWRMIWAFLPPEASRKLQVRADASARGLEPDPGRHGGFTELIVGPDFIKDLDAENLDLRVTMLRTVLLGRAGAIAKLKADFGFAAVEEEPSTPWTVGRLAATYAGLTRVPTGDRAALAGVTLKRVGIIQDNGKLRSGMFSWNVPTVDSATSAPELTQKLRLADNAFLSPDRAADVVVHEVGHAVESDKQRHAQLATGIAAAAGNAAMQELDNASSAAQSSLRGASARFKAYLAADRNAATAFNRAALAAHEAIRLTVNALTSGNLTAAGALEKAANTAVKARDTARKALPQANPAQNDYADAIDRQNEWLAAAHTALIAATAVDKAKKTEHAAEASLTESERLKRFAKFVGDRRIAPISDRAQDGIEEFYAEAYSMWRNHPKRLPAQLKGFFDRGDYLK
jgi:hypothetical protein